MAQKEIATNGPTIIGIDIGTSKITAVIARIVDENPIIVGFAGRHFSYGSHRKEQDITDITASHISQVVKDACFEAGCSISSAIVGVSCIGMGINSQQVAKVDDRVSDRHIQSALHSASRIGRPRSMAILEQVINSFTLATDNDELEGVENPVGMECTRLDTHIHTVLYDQEWVNTISKACKLAGLTVERVTSSELAAAELLLTQEEKKEGVCLLDCGGECTSMLVYRNGALTYTTSIPWGGDHLDNCLKYRLGVHVGKAEKAKIVFSKLAAGNDEQSKAIREVLDREFLVFSSHLDTELSKAGLEDGLKTGIVLTGGTANLQGLFDTLGRVLQMPVRHAELPSDQWLNKIPSDYASAAGLILRKNRRFGASVNFL